MTTAEVFVRVASADDGTVIESHRASSRLEAANYRGTVGAAPDPLETIDLVGGMGTSVFGSLRMGRVDEGRWHIDHVFVEPDAREVGIGDALLLHALELLRRHDATWIGATALPGDRSMKNLFERHGLVAQSISVGKSL